MKRVISGTIAAIAAFGISGLALADSVEEVWNCTLEEDKTVEDVQAANSKWLAYVHANVSKDVSSSVVTAIVGETTGFMFVDSYPDLETWQKVKNRLDDNPAVEDLFDGVSECSKNALYSREPTK